jgi:hypothetical protein
MNRPVKIILITLSVLAGFYLLIDGLLTSILGDRAKTETEYNFSIDNRTTDTLYIERPIDDVPWDKIISINGRKYLMLPPNACQIYCIANRKEDEDSETYKWPIKDTLSLIEKNGTLKFVFNEKQKINIQTDHYGNETITRIIN